MDCWYFAYGSNLLVGQMIARTGQPRPEDEPPRVTRLEGYRLAFNMLGEEGQHFANIVQPGEGVLGVAYHCGPEAMAKLDSYERGYARQVVEVIDAAGEHLEAVAYVARPERVAAEGRPDAEYLRKIVVGAREHGLAAGYIDEIVRRA